MSPLPPAPSPKAAFQLLHRPETPQDQQSSHALPLRGQPHPSSSYAHPPPPATNSKRLPPGYFDGLMAHTGAADPAEATNWEGRPTYGPGKGYSLAQGYAIS